MTEAKGYGGALFELAEESGRTEAILGDLKTAELAFRENPKYKTLLDTPALSKEERLALIDEAFAGADEYLLNVIKMLCEKRAVHLFGEVACEFCSLYDEARGIERVEAVTAVAMTDGQKNAMASKLEAITGKTVVLNNKIDPSIIGGVVLRYSGVQLDGSIKTRLDEFKKNLSNIVM